MARTEFKRLNFDLKAEKFDVMMARLGKVINGTLRLFKTNDCNVEREGGGNGEREGERKR